MDPFDFCPVVDCVAEPTEVLDVRIYVNGDSVPLAWTCKTHYDAITLAPKDWTFDRSWDQGLVISPR